MNIIEYFHAMEKNQGKRVANAIQEEIIISFDSGSLDLEEWCINNGIDYYAGNTVHEWLCKISAIAYKGSYPYQLI